ncbi:unnamed protein product (macronuclear) [Paramecium tetraurelia]|uniref:RING-type domain-containing protein n=1 Tax=Paramecium tetraurelia TaxID=5888 RepID=A0DJ31_PARTE|nr:uncharacterized protein GSPATT00017405001 [Paramecium tetraurelia]CAK83048.1 unnamed protein product [Paramecium tetraurelia]|eukprot:XP_001450445.1 hypothetical protein (macronuclear) [Paramecium tetraurelia strain d4-2]
MQSTKLERNFVNENLISKYLKCIICSAVFDEPTRLRCGHTFCKLCISQWLTDHQTCPECRQDAKRKHFQIDRIAAGIISELDVYCSNKIYGCKWKGVIDRLESHQRKCTAKIVAEQLNLKIQSNQETDEDNELACQNDPGNLVTRINANLKDKKEVIDALKSSNENTKDDNLEDDDPLAFLNQLHQFSEENPLEEMRKIDFSDEDLPKQSRGRIIPQLNE